MPKGRPKKENLFPVFDVAKGRWKLDVPASMAGIRKKFFFNTQEAALMEASKIIGKIKQGVEIKKGEPTGQNLSRLIAAYLAERKPETSPDNYTTLNWGLGIVAEEYGKMMPEGLSPGGVNAWIKTLKKKYETRTRFNIFAAGRTFFNSRPVREIVPVNPFQDTPPKKQQGARLSVLTPAQMKILLALDSPTYFRAWLVAGAFAGLRTIEFKRMSYEAFDYEHSEIVVKSHESKQGEAAAPRNITITEALERNMPRGEGPLLGGSTWKTMGEALDRAREALELNAWPKNTLRHSFGSYRLAELRDPSRVSYEMGHASPKLLWSVYGNQVTRKDAATWWAL
jgi:hypothetical protein